MTGHPDAKFMTRAIELSEKAGLVEKSGGVFGVVIVKDGRIIAEGYNRVIKEKDPTVHAEIDAIRNAAKVLQNPHLDGCVMYSSAYCCPMCLCAAYWAHIQVIYYGARMEDTKRLGDFLDVDYYAELAKEDNKRLIPMKEFMRNEAVAVWEKFAKLPDRARY